MRCPSLLRRLCLCLCLCFSIAGVSGATVAPAPQPDGAALAQALADPARPADDRALDPLRKPAELAAFAGLKAGDRVADFMSGNGYFARILSRVVGPAGRVYAFLPAQQLANCSPRETLGTKALEHNAHYPNVQVLIDAADRFAAPEPLDVVWMSLGYHDLHDSFMQPVDIAALNSAVYRALKPGGVYLIVDHVAAPGSGLRDTETLHRIDPESLRAEVTAAGFVLEAQSAVLRNDADAHTLKVFDPAIRHRTDQVVFRFRKPG